MLPSSAPTIIAVSEAEQEELATEFAKFMRAWVHKLANGVIFITK